MNKVTKLATLGRGVNVVMHLPPDAFPPYLKASKVSVCGQDDRSASQPEFDIKAIFLGLFHDVPEQMSGQDRIRNLIDLQHDFMRLGAGAALAIVRNAPYIPSNWCADKTNIYFDGTVFKDGTGNFYVLQISRENGKSEWRMRLVDLDDLSEGSTAVIRI